MFRALAVIAAFALLVYALADFANSDERDRGGVPGWLWIVIIVVLPYFGPIAWIVFSRSRRGQSVGTGHTSPRGPSGARRRPTGPLAPDDDPDFLWRLAREQQRQGQGGRTPETTGTGPDPVTGDPSGQTPHSRGPRDHKPTDETSHESPSRDQKPRSGSHDEPGTDTAPEV